MKQQLSFKYTQWYRRAIISVAIGGPLLWGAFFFGNQWLQKLPTVISSRDAAIIAIGALVMGGFTAYKLTGGLMDEVWLEGDDLLVCRKGREERVPLLAVQKVTPSRYWSPERLRLDLASPCAFGKKKVVFIMPMGAGREVVHQFVQELDRVHTAGRADLKTPPLQ